MKQRYWLFTRGGVYYVQDTETGQQSSLQTRDRDEADRIRAAKNEASARPTLGLALARAYLAAYDPEMVERTWTHLMAEFSATGGPSTQAMRRKVLRRKPFDLIRKKRITETTADQLRAVLLAGGVMVNHTLRCLHNLAIGMGWLPWPIIPPKLWPKPRTKPKRGIGEQQYQVRLTDRQQDEVEAVDEVADATVKCLLRTVPAAVPGIAFLSGGQPAELASARLNAMNARFKARLPWALTYSFARAIQQPALEIWKGDEANVSAAQQALLHRARCNGAARRGEYTAAMERTGA